MDDGTQAVHDGRVFYEWLGLYLVHWSSFELALDIALWKLSGLSPDAAAEKYGRLVVADKVKAVRGLIRGNANETPIAAILDKLPSESVRNLISHGRMRFGADKLVVAMIGRDKRLIRREFSRLSFMAHLSEMADLANEFEVLLGLTQEDAETLWQEMG